MKYDSYRKVTLYSGNTALDEGWMRREDKSTDIGIRLLANSDGKYAVDDNGHPKFGKWFDNIGLMTYRLHPCHDEFWIGIYVKDNDQFGMMYHTDMKDRLPWTNMPWHAYEKYPYRQFQIDRDWPDICRYFDSMTEMDIRMPYYNEYLQPEDSLRHELYQMWSGLYINWVKDETVKLDDDCKIVPKYDIGWQGVLFLAKENEYSDYYSNGTWPLYIDGQKNPKIQEFIDDFMDMKNNDPEKLADMKSDLYYGRYGRKEWEEDHKRHIQKKKQN